MIRPFLIRYGKVYPFWITAIEKQITEIKPRRTNRCNLFLKSLPAAGRSVIKFLMGFSARTNYITKVEQEHTKMNSGCVLNREAGYFTLGLFKERNVNPVRERSSFTPLENSFLMGRVVCADGDIEPPSALSGNNRQLKSEAFSNGVNAIFSIKPASYKSVISPHDEGVIENKKRLCRLLGLDFKRLIYLNQMHDCNIYVAKNLKTIRPDLKAHPLKELGWPIPLDNGKRSAYPFWIKPPKGGFDAVITAEKKLPLAIFTADCLPIFFSDTNSTVIALAHAGWRGTHKRISQKVISRLKAEFNINPEDLIVGLGPSLRGCCYEVTGEFLKLFPDSITKKGKRYYFDLIKENIDQLVESGVRKDNIFDSRFCTFCSNELFFSYRREGKDCGRTISLIALG